MNKGFYFQKVHLDKNTELLISNHQYDLEVQFQWADMKKYYIIPSLTVEKQKNGCKASKINACSRFLFRNDMCYCAIFFTLW